MAVVNSSSEPIGARTARRGDGVSPARARRRAELRLVRSERARLEPRRERRFDYLKRIYD